MPCFNCGELRHLAYQCPLPDKRKKKSKSKDDESDDEKDKDQKKKQSHKNKRNDKKIFQSKARKKKARHILVNGSPMKPQKTLSSLKLAALEMENEHS